MRESLSAKEEHSAAEDGQHDEARNQPYPGVEVGLVEIQDADG